MGTSTSTYRPNQLRQSVQDHVTVHLAFRHFAVAGGLFKKPSHWAERIDDSTWNEFTSCCRNCTTSPGINATKERYKAYQCQKTVAILAILGAGVTAIALLATGSNAGFVVLALIIGLLGVGCGCVFFISAPAKKQSIKRHFLQGVRRNLLSSFAPLNQKYVNQIQFNVPEIGNGPPPTNVRGSLILAIDIAIWGDVQRVQYVNNAPRVDVIQKQMTQTSSTNVPITYMVMPDGRMVPASMPQAPLQVQYQAVHGLQTQGPPPVQYQPVSAQGQPPPQYQAVQVQRVPQQPQQPQQPQVQYKPVPQQPQQPQIQYQPVPAQGQPPMQYQAVPEHVQIHIEPQVELQKVVPPPPYNQGQPLVAPLSEPNAVPIPSAPGIDDDEVALGDPGVNDTEGGGGGGVGVGGAEGEGHVTSF